MKCGFIRSMTGQQAKQHIQKSKRPVIVRFFAHWCQACHASEARVKEAHQQSCNADVIAVDGDSVFNKEFVDENNVDGFPTLVAFKDGKKVGTFAGGETTMEYKAFFDKWTKKYD